MPKPIEAGRFPVMKSDKQKILEIQGCVFRGQERLDNHEINTDKDCYCGRPLKSEQQEQEKELVG